MWNRRDFPFCGGMFVQMWETFKCKCYTSHQTAAFHSVSTMKPLFSTSFNSVGEPFLSQGHKQAFYVFFSPKHVQTTTQLIPAQAASFHNRLLSLDEKSWGTMGGFQKNIYIFFSPFPLPLPFSNPPLHPVPPAAPWAAVLRSRSRSAAPWPQPGGSPWVLPVDVGTPRAASAFRQSTERGTGKQWKQNNATMHCIIYLSLTPTTYAECS